MWTLDLVAPAGEGCVAGLLHEAVDDAEPSYSMQELEVERKDEISGIVKSGSGGGWRRTSLSI